MAEHNCQEQKVIWGDKEAGNKPEHFIYWIYRNYPRIVLCLHISKYTDLSE